MQNALNYVRMLEEKGVPKEQAEVTVSVIHEMVHQEFATKHDLEKLRIATKHDMDEFRANMNYRFDSFEQRMNAKFEGVDARFKQLEDKMTIKMGGMISFAIVMIVTLQKIL